jgi:hypothetical protein
MSTKYVLLYESGDDLAEKAPIHFPAHTKWGQGFHERRRADRLRPVRRPAA